MQNCIYIRKRHRKGIPYFYCTLLKKEIPFSCYQECDKKEYKQYKRLQAKKEYKYKPKKGKCSRYYNDISIMPISTLYFNKKTKGCQKHHIFGNVANRPKSEAYGLFVWLTPEQHKYLHDHPLEMTKLKKIAQATFMNHYSKSIEEFIDIFGKSWIQLH